MNSAKSEPEAQTQVSAVLPVEDYGEQLEIIELPGQSLSSCLKAPVTLIRIFIVIFALVAFVPPWYAQVENTYLDAGINVQLVESGPVPGIGVVTNVLKEDNFVGTGQIVDDFTDMLKVAVPYAIDDRTVVQGSGLLAFSETGYSFIPGYNALPSFHSPTCDKLDFSDPELVERCADKEYDIFGGLRLAGAFIALIFSFLSLCGGTTENGHVGFKPALFLLIAACFSLTIWVSWVIQAENFYENIDGGITYKFLGSPFETIKAETRDVIESGTAGLLKVRITTYSLIRNTTVSPYYASFFFNVAHSFSALAAGCYWSWKLRTAAISESQVP